MIDVRTMRPDENCYTFVADDGENFHITSSKLLEWCQVNSPEVVLAPVDRALAETFRRDNLISIERANQLAFELLERGKLDPIIFCKVFGVVGHEVMLVDGHHRYYVQRNLSYALSHILEPAQWEPFRITGIPDTTKEAVIASPVYRRDYW